MVAIGELWEAFRRSMPQATERPDPSGWNDNRKLDEGAVMGFKEAWRGSGPEATKRRSPRERAERRKKGANG